MLYQLLKYLLCLNANKQQRFKYEIASDQMRRLFQNKNWEWELEVTAHTKWKKSRSGSGKSNGLIIANCLRFKVEIDQ